jgi:hypothetical protein
MLFAAVLFYASMVAGDARQSANPLRYGWGHALFVVTFGFPFAFPLLLLIQWLLVKAVVRIRHGRGAQVVRTPRVLYCSYLPMLLICAMTMSSYVLRDDDYYYRH